MTGVRNGDALVLTRHFWFDDGHQQQRVWHVKRLDGHRYEVLRMTSWEPPFRTTVWLARQRRQPEFQDLGRLRPFLW